MNELDEKIREALTNEDQKAIDEIDSGAGLFDLIGQSFSGKQAWMMYYMYALGLVVTGLLIYFVIQYLGTDDIKTSLTWALLIITALFMIAMVKIMAWQQMQKLELMRELKRLEMRIMLIAEHQEQD